MEILTIDYCRFDAGKYFVKSLHETGFAVIKNHPIQYALVKNVFAEWQDFFSSHNKFQYPYNKTKGDGYVGLATSEKAKGSNAPDLKEFYQIYQPWGRYPKELSNNSLIYFEQTFKLAVNLLTWLDEFSPQIIKKYFSEKLAHMMSSEQTMLRVLHYPPLTGNENTSAIRAAAHEDINLITLLPASNAMGLQVKSKDGKWHDVGTQEGEIIINVGDMLQECSNYYYISTTHRVINPDNKIANQSRFSMPLFIHPRPDVFLSEKYTTAKQYLTERLIELGLLD